MTNVTNNVRGNTSGVNNYGVNNHRGRKNPESAQEQKPSYFSASQKDHTNANRNTSNTVSEFVLTHQFSSAARTPTGQTDRQQNTRSRMFNSRNTGQRLNQTKNTAVDKAVKLVEAGAVVQKDDTITIPHDKKNVGITHSINSTGDAKPSTQSSTTTNNGGLLATIRRFFQRLFS